MNIAPYNVSALLDLGSYWGSKLTQEQTASIVEDVYDAFEAFKTNRVQSDGTIEYWELQGLLGAKAPGWNSEFRPADAVEPFRCAGPWIMNDVDLAFHLLQASDPKFMAALGKHGIAQVFWAVGGWSSPEINLDSLVRLNTLFIMMLKFELEAAHAHLEAAKEVGAEMFTELRKRDQDLVERAANARLEREEKRKREIRSGSDLRSQYRSLALDYAVHQLRAGGLPTFSDAKNYVASKTGRSPDTVKKYLAGILDEAHRKFVAPSK